MLRRVETRPMRLEDYVGVAPAEQVEGARELGRLLKGTRVVHINSTANGGGVAEILRGLVPLMRDVGVDAEWYVLEADSSYFSTTKRLHNLLQGSDGALSRDEAQAYVKQNERGARYLVGQGVGADVWMLHDPQALPMGGFLPLGTPRVWICHLDTTAPNRRVIRQLLPWMERYSRVLFSLPEYLVPGLNADKASFVSPAIHPFTIKNQDPGRETARSILAGLGLDPERPILAQVARFDRWKDPKGVIDAYRLVKGEFPPVQLALVGVIEATDDPEALVVVDDVRGHAGDDPDIHLFTDPSLVGQREVAAFQKGADVVIQKSVREGFGLSVTEALWKGTPVVGGDCGGIRLQIVDGESGFLVDSVEACAQRVLDLLRSPQLARQMGAVGKERVRERFLMSRLLRDYLALAAGLGGGYAYSSNGSS